MTSTIPRSQKYWVRLYLVARDGGKCDLCGLLAEGLDIDHIDGNPANHNPSNLRLLCRSCNVKTAIKNRRDIGRFVEREGESGHEGSFPNADATSILKSKVNYSSGSPEMQVNDYTEIEFRNWITALLLKKKVYPLDDAVADGAEKTGASVNAVRNYLKKMLSPLYGPLKKFKFAGRGNMFITFKPNVRAALDRGDLLPRQVADGELP